MEPSGRNQWQPGGNWEGPETARTSQNRCHRLRPVADRSSEREEVDSGVLADSGERNVVTAAKRPAFDDVGVDADIRLIVLRRGTQDAGIFG